MYICTGMYLVWYVYLNIHVYASLCICVGVWVCGCECVRTQHELTVFDFSKSTNGMFIVMRFCCSCSKLLKGVNPPGLTPCGVVREEYIHKSDSHCI